MSKYIFPKGEYSVYINGTCTLALSGAGGSACVIVPAGKPKSQRTFSEGYFLTTSFRMEIRAIEIALNNIEQGSEIQIHSNNQTIINCLNGDWNRHIHKDLWNRIFERKHDYSINGVYLPDFEENKYGIECNKQCSFAKKHPKLHDSVYENGNIEEEPAKKESEDFYKLYGGYTNTDQTFGSVYVNLLMSPKFQALSPAAKAFYVACRAQARTKSSIQVLYKHGQECGVDYSTKIGWYFVFPSERLKEFGYERRNVTRLFDQLEDAGFIERVERNGLKRRVNIYRFSGKWNKQSAQ